VFVNSLELYHLARSVCLPVGRTSFVIAKDHNPAEHLRAVQWRKYVVMFSPSSILSTCFVPRSPHTWARSLGVPLGQIRWHTSKYKSILNSDSSMTSSGSQNCPAFPNLQSGKNIGSVHCNVNSQGAAHEATLINSYITGGFRCGKYIWLQGTLKEKSISNGLKRPHDIKAFGSSPLAACSFPMGVGGPKLMARHTVVEHYHPLCRVAAIGRFPECTGCVGFTPTSRSLHPTPFHFHGIALRKQNPDDVKPRSWQNCSILDKANAIL
jgi:hypothetical protein